MNSRRIARIWTMGVAIGLLGVLPTAAQTPGFGRTIAEITAGQNNLDRARSLYGPGAEKTTSIMFGACAITSNRSKPIFRHQHSSGRIESEALCSQDSRVPTPGCHDAKVSGKHLLTGPSGIKLGDMMEDVLQLLDEGWLRVATEIGIPKDCTVVNHAREGEAGMRFRLHHKLRRPVDCVVGVIPDHYYSVDTRADHVVDLPFDVGAVRLPARISDEYGSLRPSAERIRDFAIVASAG